MSQVIIIWVAIANKLKCSGIPMTLIIFETIKVNFMLVIIPSGNKITYK